MLYITNENGRRLARLTPEQMAHLVVVLQERCKDGAAGFHTTKGFAMVFGLKEIIEGVQKEGG
jgi:hypothetical protein